MGSFLRVLILVFFGGRSTDGEEKLRVERMNVSVFNCRHARSRENAAYELSLERRRERGHRLHYRAGECRVAM